MSAGQIRLDPAVLRREAKVSDGRAGTCSGSATSLRGASLAPLDMGLLGQGLVVTANRSGQEIAEAIRAVGDLWDRIATALVATAEDHVEVDRRVTHRLHALGTKIAGVDELRVGG